MKHLGLAVLLTGVAAIAAAQPVPETVAGYVVTADIQAIAPDMKVSARATPEGQAMAGALRNISKLQSRFSLAQDLSRQEILSADFVLPAGALVMHKSGDRFYIIADPKAQSYVVMDAADLLTALEGGVGVINTAYDAKVAHTDERKEIAGYPCRKSIATVTYAASVPLENERIMVQQQNDIEIWHTSHLVSGSALEHLFFKFQQDRTETCRKAIRAEIGFPMEIRFVVTQQGAKKGTPPQPGSFHMIVTDVKQEKKLASSQFAIPPAGYRKVDKNPYFAAAMAK
ncbi:MAG TPA: DUF4412 domain-containing protein [Vicinamibacteria bacterium]|nr:DUF4412 domain-containing protein [Vicinamibacteria bacterium]